MPNAKTYPHWKELIASIPNAEFVQIGKRGELALVKDFRVDLSLNEIRALLLSCKTWFSVDSFLPHLAHHVRKPGIVIWSVSDPDRFGYKENVNILRSRKYLRANQYDIWEAQSYIHDAFPTPAEILAVVDLEAF